MAPLYDVRGFHVALFPNCISNSIHTNAVAVACRVACARDSTKPYAGFLFPSNVNTNATSLRFSV